MTKKIEKKTKKKLIVIGIDGGTFNVIEPLLKSGKLPNLKKFKNRSILKSTTPPGTAVAWASISTGNLPGKTNIYDFTIVEDKSWKIKFVNRNLLGSKPLWEFLDGAGLKSCFINIPLTYPPEKINGVMISGIDAPSTFSNYVYPSELKSKLKEFDYEIEVSGLKDKNEVVKQAIEILDKRIATSKYLLKENFDFFIVLFRESDVAQHFAWGQKEVEDVYTKIDDFLGHVMKRAKKNGENVIVMSDHGHENVEKAFNVNVWLENEGYLKTKIKKGSLLSTFGITRERIFKILESLKLAFLVKIIPRKLGKKIPTKDVDFEEAIINNLIDFGQTKAIAKRAVKTSQIFLNREERGGIVKKNEEEKLKKEIVEKLKEFFKKNNLETEIKTKEELYGDDTRYAPDITLYFKEKHYDVLTSISPQKKLWDKTREQATHNTEGVIFCDLDLNFKDARIIDLTPTILDYFGIKKGKFDGKSLLR